MKKLGRTAAVSRPQVGIIVVLDKQCASENPAEIERFTSAISSATQTAALAVLIHDSDILMYWLAEGGKVVDRYDSMPSYDTMDDPPRPPSGGDAAKLARAFGRQGSELEIEMVLRTPFDDDRYLFAQQRHEDLCLWLGLPWPLSGMGYTSYESDRVPGISGEFTRVETP